MSVEKRVIEVKCDICDGSRKMIEIIDDKKTVVDCEFCDEGHKRLNIIDLFEKTLSRMQEEAVKEQRWDVGVLFRDALASYRIIKSKEKKKEPDKDEKYYYADVKCGECKKETRTEARVVVLTRAKSFPVKLICAHCGKQIHPTDEQFEKARKETSDVL